MLSKLGFKPPKISPKDLLKQMTNLHNKFQERRGITDHLGVNMKEVDKNVYVLSGSRKKIEKMLEETWTGTFLDPKSPSYELYKFIDVLSPEYAKKFKKHVINKPKGSFKHSRGVVLSTTKGKKAFIIDDGFLFRMPKEKLDTIIAHEKFHLKPYIGRSETLAHIAGGWGAGGTKKERTIRAAEQYVHGWKTQPFQMSKPILTVGSITAYKKMKNAN